MKKVTPVKKTAAAKKEVKRTAAPVVENKQLVRQSSSAVDDMLAEDARSGMENMTMESFAIPRLAILQALSPQVLKGNEAQLDGAEAGMIFENVSQTLWDGETGLLFLPISYRFTHNKWWPRDSSKSKGFIADLGPDPKVMDGTKKDDKNRILTADGAEIVPTHEYFGFIIDEDTLETTPVLLGMARTQGKKAKRFNSLTQIVVPHKGSTIMAPIFYRSYRLTTVPETNNKGQSYFNWDINYGPALLERAKDHIVPTPDVFQNGDQIYLAARNFKARVDKGDVKVAQPVDDHVQGTSNSNEEPM